MEAFCLLVIQIAESMEFVHVLATVSLYTYKG